MWAEYGMSVQRYARPLAWQAPCTRMLDLAAFLRRVAALRLPETTRVRGPMLLEEAAWMLWRFSSLNVPTLARSLGQRVRSWTGADP
jgi:hypothetical protein